MNKDFAHEQKRKMVGVEYNTSLHACTVELIAGWCCEAVFEVVVVSEILLNSQFF